MSSFLLPISKHLTTPLLRSQPNQRHRNLTSRFNHESQLKFIAFNHQLLSRELDVDQVV